VCTNNAGLPVCAPKGVCATANGGCDTNADCAVDSNDQAVCTCRTGFTGTGLQCTANEFIFDGGEGNPCPSDCWNWNTELKTCSLKVPNSCFTLTCESNMMKLEFVSKLLNVQDSDTDPFGADGAQFSASKWRKDCDLGDCGHTVSTNSNGNLEFAYDVSRSMQTLTLDTTNVLLAPVSTAITFICEYPSTVEVESDAITVKGATATGTTSHIGDLTDGFDLELFVDDSFSTAADATNLFIGQPAFVKLSWSVTSATSTINFLVDGCRVKDTTTDKEVAIIKNNCYANSLGVTQLSTDKKNDLEFKFSFISFTLGTSQNIQMTAKMTCTVKMCVKAETGCVETALDADCPTDAGYDYKASITN